MLFLQGEFNAREPVAAVFEWVSSGLRDFSTTYELILPSRKPLSPVMGRIADADLLPSALLNFRCTDTHLQARSPTLNDDLLRQIQ